MNEGRLLALRFEDGLSLADAARVLGWSRRTAYRRWERLVARLTRAHPDEGGRSGAGSPANHVISLDRTG